MDAVPVTAFEKKATVEVPTPIAPPPPVAPPTPPAPTPAAKAAVKVTQPVFTTPPVVTQYGASGVGKTADALFAFPGALFLAAPGALKPCVHLVGVQPHVMDDVSFKELPGVLKRLKPTAVVVDDGSLAAESEMRASTQHGLLIVGSLRKDLLNAADALRDAGIPVVYNCHEQPPRVMPTTILKGGPQLPGRMANELPAKSDLVLRAVHAPDRKGWPWGYQCNNEDPQYTTKDRHAMTPDRSPMNLGEILRNCGYIVPRTPQMDWAESVVEAIAVKLRTLDRALWWEELKTYPGPMQAKFKATDQQINWVFRDAVDRADLRNARKSRWAAFLE